jgi:hypothetical protein
VALPCVKKLVTPGQTVIPSNLPRTHLGLDSRGFRICVAQLARSCALKQGFITFTDGSAYAYDSPSNADMESLCASLQRGRDFNFSVRRSRGGYARGFTPPGDFEVIYTYPPYPGTVPTACPLPGPDWPSSAWAQFTFSPGSGQTWTITPDPGASDTMQFDVVSAAGSSFGDATYNGSLSYTGGMHNCQVALTGTAIVSNVAWHLFVFVSQGAATLLNTSVSGTGNGGATFPFTVNDTAGVADTLNLQVVCEVFGSVGGGETLLKAVFSNV